jgi:FkbM family methyltransferase
VEAAQGNQHGYESMTATYKAALRGTTVRSLRWALSAPVRLYLRHSPILHGKGLVERWLYGSCVPKNAEVEISLPLGDKIKMNTSEKLGRHLLVYKTFEIAELEFCRSVLKSGESAIDVGANIGLFTLTLAQLVGKTGRVIAIEPSPVNFSRLVHNIQANSRDNVVAIQIALGGINGVATMAIDVDPAFGCAVLASGVDSADGKAVSVAMRMLDEVWIEKDAPLISLIKIDVEGGESQVLAGAMKMIRQCKPIILIEATSVAQLQDIEARLSPIGYAYNQPYGFQDWNYVFHVASGHKI